MPVSNVMAEQAVPFVCALLELSLLPPYPKTVDAS